MPWPIPIDIIVLYLFSFFVGLMSGVVLAYMTLVNKLKGWYDGFETGESRARNSLEAWILQWERKGYPHRDIPYPIRDAVSKLLRSKGLPVDD
jgi:hypothetical protein